MFKSTILLVSLAAILLAGCNSTDQRYKREVEGNDSYLKTTELKPIIVPAGVKVPQEITDFYIYKAANEGQTGKEVDIRPPALPIPTIADAYANYDNGVVTLDSPEYSTFWDKIPAILQYKNIPTVRNDGASIQTGGALINRVDETQPVEASYLLKRSVRNGREYITVELTSLKRMGQDLKDVIEEQRYTVDFFNMIMKEIAPATSPSQVN